MKYKIAVTETMSATRYIEVEYDEDQPIVGKIGDWETEALDYSVLEEK
ncbi:MULTISPECIES: hypothetical protein [unclassified Enterococcus]